MTPYGPTASPLLTRLLAALIAAIFVAGVGGLFVVDEGEEANLPIGEPADTDLGLGADDEFDYEPGETFPSGSTPPTAAPDSGITEGTGTSLSLPPPRPSSGAAPGPTSATTASPGGSSTATTATARPQASSAGVGPTNSASEAGIYSIQPDGKGLYRVVPGGTGFPTWSPNGNQIAFAVPTSNPRYMIADSDGGTRFTLAGGRIGSPPAFSPDSSRVIFSLGHESGFDVHSVSAAGGDLRRLSSRGDVSGVAVSPTGQIAFLSGGDVWLMAADGGGARVLVDSERAYRAITFSRDGARIAWYAGDKVWTANADGSAPRPAASTEGRVLEWNDITWAPDGTRVAFRSGTGGVSRVRVVGFDGTGNHTAAEDAQAPDWSPGGNRLAIFTAGAVGSNGDREAHLELADPDRATFRQRVLDDSPGVIQSSGPRYSRDGSRLVFSVGGLDRGGPNPPAA